MPQLILTDLCDYCDEELPENPSPRLVSLLAKPLRGSRLDPTPSNPNHRTVSLARSIDICLLHRAERDVIPLGITKGYPGTLDFDRVPSRLRRHFPTLRALIASPVGNRLFDDLVEKVDAGLNLNCAQGRMYGATIAYHG